MHEDIVAESKAKQRKCPCVRSETTIPRTRYAARTYGPLCLSPTRISMTRATSTRSINTPGTLSLGEFSRAYHTPAFPRRNAYCSDPALVHGQRFLLSLHQRPWGTCTALRERQEARGRSAVTKGQQKQFARRGIESHNTSLRLLGLSSPGWMRRSATWRHFKASGSWRSGWRTETSNRFHAGKPVCDLP